MTSTTSCGNYGRAAQRLSYRLDRRRALGLLALSGVMATAGRGQAASNDPMLKPLRYLAYVDGDRSGIQDIEFVPRDRGFTVMSSLCMRLEFAFVTVYRYQKTGQEDWKDGKLLAFEFITNNDGKTSHVTAQRDGSDNFSVIGQNGQRTVPGDAVAASFWNGAILDRPHIIDPRTGELATLSVRSLEQKSAKIASRTIHGNGYAFQTYINGDLWFDEHQRSLALTFEKDRHKIELVREA
jgi:Family of unknown function (DUF6134)